MHGVRLSKFEPEYSQKYEKETIERSKEQGNFFCKACGTNYTLGKNGAKNIEAHIKTNKHKERLKDYNQNRPKKSRLPIENTAQMTQKNWMNFSSKLALSNLN